VGVASAKREPPRTPLRLEARERSISAVVSLGSARGVVRTVELCLEQFLGFEVEYRSSSPYLDHSLDLVLDVQGRTFVGDGNSLYYDLTPLASPVPLRIKHTGVKALTKSSFRLARDC
jgi:hypothetical protein